MFGRRVFGSGPIPRSMYARLRISTPAQASRLLPTLVPLSPALALSAGGLARAILQGSAETVPRLDVADQDPVLLRALLESVSPLQLGFSRLFELWGIARAIKVNSSKKERSATVPVASSSL